MVQLSIHFQTLSVYLTQTDGSIIMAFNDNQVYTNVIKNLIDLDILHVRDEEAKTVRVHKSAVIIESFNVIP